MDYQKMISNYKIRILMAKDKEIETNKVINEIHSLTDIKNSEKEIILNQLLEELKKHSFENFSLDNKEYLKLVEKALKLIGDKKE